MDGGRGCSWHGRPCCRSDEGAVHVIQIDNPAGQATSAPPDVRRWTPEQMRPTLRSQSQPTPTEQGFEMTHPTDKELLADLLAKRDWLRRNPTGMAALTTKRRIKEIERELESRGVAFERSTVASSPRPSRTIWYVAVNDRDQPGQCIHAERDCMHLSDTRLERVREATEHEIAHLAICSTCG